MKCQKEGVVATDEQSYIELSVVTVLTVTEALLYLIMEWLVT